LVNVPKGKKKVKKTEKQVIRAFTDRERGEKDRRFGGQQASSGMNQGSSNKQRGCETDQKSWGETQERGGLNLGGGRRLYGVLSRTIAKRRVGERVDWNVQTKEEWVIKAVAHQKRLHRKKTAGNPPIGDRQGAQC